MGGGFSQNDSIRTSEIKGLMRYWFRAVAGSVIGNDIKALKKLEEKVFGSQERKSPFRIVIGKERLSYLNKYSQEFQFSKDMNGLVYLGIGNVLFKWNKAKQKWKFNEEKINIIAPNSTFKVKFLFKNSVDEKIIKLVAYSFYLSTALGGFGLRARRGFGSWQIVDVETEGINENLDNLKDYGLKNTNNIIDEAKSTLKSFHKVDNNLNKNMKLNYTNFINYELKQINPNKTNWKDLLNDLGAYYRYFRVNPISIDLQKDNFKRKHTKDYDEILNKRKKVKELYNPIFGLNIIYKKYISVRLNSESETLRRASPLFISIKEINNNLVINLFVSKSTNFKDNKHKVEVKINRNNFPVNLINENNYQTITDFMEKLNNAMGKDNGN